MPQQELSAQQLYRPCRLDGLDFRNTADLDTLDQPLGQARALEAIEFGVDIKKNGFNVFALASVRVIPPVAAPPSQSATRGCTSIDAYAPARRSR